MRSRVKKWYEAAFAIGFFTALTCHFLKLEEELAEFIKNNKGQFRDQTPEEAAEEAIQRAQVLARIKARANGKVPPYM